MLSISTFQVLTYLAIILTICLIPVYLLRRDWKEVFATGSILIYSCMLYRQFVWGRVGTYHDSMQHQFLFLILKQWLDANSAIGWNPYMNAGEPLYLFSNSFLYPPWIGFCLLNRLVHLDPYILFNIAWYFQFIFFSTGALLLFLILFDNFRVAFFCLITLVFSGMFIVNLGQPTGLTIIWLFPYIIFCIIFSFKKRNLYGLLLALLFIGLAINNYNPTYTILTVGIFTLLFIIFHCRGLFQNRHSFKLNYKKILFTLIIFFIIISPALMLYLEMSDYVSPTRGGTMASDGIRIGRSGLQPNVNSPLWGYKVFLGQATNYRENIHHAFYLGLIPLFLIPLAFFQWRNKYLWITFFSIIAFVLLGLGNDFAGYRFLIRHIPGCNMLRHSFGFAHFTCLFLIIFSGYGLTEFLRQNRKFSESVILIILVVCSISLMREISKSTILHRFGIPAALSIILLLILEIAWPINLRKLIGLPIFYFTLLGLVIFDLTFFISATRFNPVSRADFVPIRYPQARRLLVFSSWVPPPDLSPLIFKRAALTPPDEDYVMFRNKRFDAILKSFFSIQVSPAGLNAETPLIFFTPYAEILPKDSTKEEIIKNIHLQHSLRPVPPFTRKVLFYEKDIDFSKLSDSSPLDITGEHSLDYVNTGSPNRIEVVADVPSDGFLVRLENYHKYWRAWIDGKRTKIYLADYAFQAVKIPYGHHHIIFEFKSPYPLLFWMNFICFIGVWGMFNFFLFRTYRKNKDG